MPRVIGIDPGTVTIDACGLEDGRMFLDRSVPTAEALADPARFVGLLEAAGPVDCIAGPSGYGLPLTRVQEATEEDLRLAFLAAEGEPGGIGGVRARRTGRSVREVSFVLLELGGAFTAALAVADGQIVDGVGGSAGPLGFRAPGALDGEVAFLAGSVPKSLLFDGGAAAVAGWDGGPGSPDALGNPQTAREHIAREAFVEGAVKTVRFLRASVPAPREIVLSGRLARVEGVRRGIAQRLEGIAPVRVLDGFAAEAKEGAQGAALIADGLCGGAHRELVATLGIREARGTVLDHLYVISRDQARRRLGLA